MRHQCRVPLLGRPADQRKAMLRGLTTQLIREGRVTTTKARARALRDEAERMITLAKDGSLASRRRAMAETAPPGSRLEQGPRAGAQERLSHPPLRAAA